MQRSWERVIGRKSETTYAKVLSLHNLKKEKPDRLEYNKQKYRKMKS
jgi:hypothetical protein